MKTKEILRKVIAIILIYTIISSLITVPISIAAGNVTVTISGTRDYDKANEVFEITNQERSAENVANLSLDKSLCDYAMMRAAEQAINYSHTRPNGEILNQILQFTSSGILINAENIAYGHSTAEEVMADGTGWMDNAGHEDNIMNPSYKSIGIGCFVTDSGAKFWVQVFSMTEAKEVCTYSGTQNVTETITISPDQCPISLTIAGLNDTNNIDIGETIAATSVKNTNYSYSAIKTSIQLSDVIWTSSNPDIFTVDSKGVVTGISAGTATLTASLGNYSKTYTITVNPEESISLNEDNITLWVGDTDTLNVTYIPEESNQGTIIWKSNNEEVATVDSNGKVTAHSKGTATITATATESGKEDKCEVIVKQPYTDMTLSNDSITLDKTETAKIEVTKIPTEADENANIEFESSNNEVATVTNDGTVTGVSAGTATITATMTTTSSGKVFTKTCDVTVQAHIESITIENGDITLYKGQTEELNVTFNPEEFVEAKALEWNSSEESVAKVIQDENGNTIVQVPEVKITTIVLNKNSVSLEKGEKDTLTAIILPENTTENTEIFWNSENSDIVRVDQEGNIEAVAPGTTKIIASTTSGISAECEVTVTCTLQSISLNLESANLVLNGTNNTINLNVTKNPIDADPSIDDVEWNSENLSVATVDDNGLVTAVAPGTAIITATLDGKVDNCVITVDVELESVTIENQDQPLELVKDQTGQLKTIINPENATIIPTAIWKSDNENIATVDGNGLVTAIAPGTTKITVDYGNGITASRDVIVTEKLANSITINNIVESILMNHSMQLSATLNPTDATDNITWESSDESVLTVDQNGNLTALKAGTAIITVTTENGLTDSIEIAVTEKHIESINVSIDNSTIKEGDVAQLEVTFNPTENTDTIENITYETSNPSIATVDNNGLITGLKAGEATVTVSVQARQGDGTINTIESQLQVNITEATEENENTGSNQETGNNENIDNSEETEIDENTENNDNNTSKVQVGEENNSQIAEIAQELTTSPHTGDMNITALIAIMVISLIGMIIIIKKK